MFSDTASPSTIRPLTVPAPIGGLNARDSLVAMSPNDAIRLINLWPQPYGVAVRKGCREWATGMVGKVETIAQWSSITGAQKMFAFVDANVFDISVRGPVGVPAVTGLTSARWDLVSMTNAAGSHLLGVNGKDNGFAYDETGIHEIVAGDGVASYTWSNLDPKDAINIELHQRRLWAVGKQSSIGHYLPPDAVFGIFATFDFGPLFYKGGYLEFLATWTMDDGNGAEDHLVAVSNTGTAVVYGGTDPSDDTKWSLVGVYNVGSPVRGGRAFTKAGGDLYLLTTQGVISMSTLLTSTRVNDAQHKFKSDKVQFRLSELVNTYAAEVDWQLIYYPSVNMLMINVPTGIYISNEQLVSNEIIDAWAEFTGLDAAVWSTVSARPFFGNYAGTVYEAWTGGLDNVLLDGTGGISIDTEAQQAYNYFNQLGANKQIGLYRLNFVVSNPISYSSAIIYDFGVASISSPQNIPVVARTLWSTAVWGQDVWGGSQLTQRVWNTAVGMGTAASIALKTRSNIEALWVSTDYSIVDGGIL